jgi:hypothetical protein
MLYKNPVLNSQETHYVSATKTNRLLLFRETITLYYENDVEYVDILWEECSILVLWHDA